jgi:hypothetical protein
MTRVGRPWVLWLVTSACVTIACARKTGSDTVDTTFAISYPDAPAGGVRATLGKRFYARPVGRCFYDDGREARWTMTGARVEDGELPPGLALEEGVITETPSQAGTYRARIVFRGVSCAGRSYDEQAVDERSKSAGGGGHIGSADGAGRGAPRGVDVRITAK